MRIESYYTPVLDWLATHPADLNRMPKGLLSLLERMARRHACKRHLAFAQEGGRRFDAASVGAFIDELMVVDEWLCDFFLADRGQRGFTCACGLKVAKGLTHCPCGLHKPPAGVQWLQKVCRGATNADAFGRHVNKRLGQDVDEILRKGIVQVKIQNVYDAAREMGLERVETPDGNRLFDPSQLELPGDVTLEHLNAVRSVVDATELLDLTRVEQAKAMLRACFAQGNLLWPPRTVASLLVEKLHATSAADLHTWFEATRELRPRRSR